MSDSTDDMRGNQISLVDFTILQFFYVFHSIYDFILSIFQWKKKPPDDHDNQQQEASSTPLTDTAPDSPKKRHFIQLYKPEPQDEEDQPVCYMNVIEFDSSTFNEEEIRKRKRSYDIQTTKDILRYQRHQRTRSDNELQRFCWNNLRSP